MAENGTMRTQKGFTLIELMITVVIIGVLAAIAYPSYTNSVTKSKRRAAEACLSSYAQYMERFYTANMRYDKKIDNTNNALPAVDCASVQNTGKDYRYQIQAVTRSTYTLAAVPSGIQATRDAACGTLTLNQAGTRGAIASCW
jgi:type IV pilus assembly protein PilE